MRCSPLVRISRSGSGTPAVSSSRSNIVSSIRSGASSPSATLRARLRVA